MPVAEGGNNVGGIRASAELDTSKFDAGVKNMGAAAEKLDPSLKRAEKGLRSLEDAGKSAGTSANFLQTTFTKLTAGFAAADLAVRAITATLRGAGEVLKTAFTSPIKEAARFETVMAKVSTVVDGSTKQSIRALGNEVLEMSRRFPKSKEELGIGLYNILQAGVDDSTDAMLLLEAATKASIGGVTEVGTASKLLTQIMNGYNLTAEETVAQLDAVFVGAQEGSAEFSELAASIGNTVNSAALLGVEIPEVVAAMEVMVNSGLSADEAATSLNRLFLSVIQASKGTGEAAELAQKLGLEFNSTALRTKGLQQFMADLARTVGDDEIAMQVLTQDVRGFRAAVALAGTGAGQFNDLLADMEDSAGATDKAFAKNADTIENFWILAKNELIAVITQAGQESLPQLKDALTDVKGAIEENRDEIREAVVALGVNLVDAIEAVVTHAPTIVQAIAQITEAIGKAISAGMWLVDTLYKISGAAAIVQGVEWLRGDAADAQWKKTNAAEEEALDRTFSQFQKLQAAKRPPPAPITPAGPSAPAAGGGSGGKEREKAIKEMERIEKDIVKAIGDQAKEAKELLENRKEELELKREMGLITEKETRELGRISGRVEFLDDKVREAADAWKDHEKAIDDSAKAVEEYGEKIAEVQADLADNLAEIDKDLFREMQGMNADSAEKKCSDGRRSDPRAKRDPAQGRRRGGTDRRHESQAGRDRG